MLNISLQFNSWASVLKNLKAATVTLTLTANISTIPLLTPLSLKFGVNKSKSLVVVVLNVKKWSQVPQTIFRENFF